MKNNCNLLAIDLGSSSARIMLAQLEDDQKFSIKELARFSHAPLVVDGIFRWDINNLFDNLQGAVDDALSKYVISSIGICSWGVDYGLITNGGKLFDQPICYRDNRGQKAYDDVHGAKSCVMTQQELFEKSGIYPNSINTLYQLVADVAEKRYCEQDCLKFVFIADLFAWRLTGKVFAEKTNASTSGLLDLDGKDWNWQLIQQLGLDGNIFPQLVNSGECYGQYKGVDVKAVCTHDTASAVYGMDGLDDESLFISSGSWILVGALCARPIVSKQVFERGYTNERGYGNCVTLLNNMNGLFVIQRLVAELGVTYKQIDEEVDSAKCLAIVDTNKLTSPQDMVGQIKALVGASDISPMDLIKTAYDSLATNIAKAIEQLEVVVNKKFKKVVITGGMSKAPYLMRQFKKLCNLEICIASGEGAIVGNAKAQIAKK
ncbi:MAG: FGGY family carbohydrate kinase [Clostridia bacterium]